ncbi:hypothetical protein HPB47_003389 [Ixodes persulcatus]|uniref:Uncharacterized protein n=1 Tax=Ixodes persulcatus TaxID=34615 RepID=A0AC60PIQ0_IXOPE|nr:hypothetical protein HPB47_003389 [Ixodes persulcatus]
MWKGDSSQQTYEVANGMARARNFIRHFTSQPRRTNQVLVPLGGNYQSAGYSFQNIDNLIRYVNAKHRDLPKARAFYSTPSCFLRALLETNESWEEVDEDLFPYAERSRNSTDVAFWTGYFSGQPDIKKTLRRANGVLQACKQLSVLGSVYSEDVRALQEAVAFGQHHEIITGTGSPEALHHHRTVLLNGMSGCQRVMAKALRSLVWEGGVREIRMLQCLAPENHCPPLSVRDAWLLVYNPLSQPYRAPLRLAVHPGYEFNVDGSPTQVLDTESATKEIAFEADLPALGRYRLLVDSSTCLLSGLMQRGASQLTLRQSFMAYHAYQGDSARASGPRVLSPVNEEPFELGYNVSCHVVKGAQVQELRQRFSSWLVQVVRLYEDQDVIEFAWEVGPVPMDDNKGKELVSRFESSVRSGNRFYSDTNGRRSIERRRIRGSPVASDFYPVTSWAYLTSDSQDVQLTVFPDRSQAASSLSSGHLEFLVQRRLPGEPGTSIKGRHWLHVGTVQDAQESLRSLANRMVWSPQLSLVDTEQKHFVNLSVKSWSGLRTPLPRYLHVLSLERVSGDRVLLRFEYQAPETSNYTHPVNLFISRLLTKQVLYHVTETSLGSTQDRDSVLRFIWRRRGAVAPVAQQQRMRVWLKRGSRSRFEDTVRILPGHIRTFVARIEKRRGLHA